MSVKLSHTRYLYICVKYVNITDDQSARLSQHSLTCTNQSVIETQDTEGNLFQLYTNKFIIDTEGIEGNFLYSMAINHLLN